MILTDATLERRVEGLAAAVARASQARPSDRTWRRVVALARAIDRVWAVVERRARAEADRHISPWMAP